MSKREILRNNTKMYRLEKDEQDNLILSVLCGGIAMYEAKLCLNSEEKERYQQEGAEFIEEMAFDISNGSSEYKERLI